MRRVVASPRDPFECLPNQYSKEDRVKSDPTPRQLPTREGEDRRTGIRMGVSGSGTDAKN